MTTYVQARDILVSRIDTALKADYPSLKVFWENATRVDVNKVGTFFLQVEINFQDEFNTTIAADTMTTGVVNFRVFCKNGTGTKSALALFDYLRNLMKHNVVSDVTLLTPRPGKVISKDGWMSYDLNAPFLFRSA